jgi:hypothetical protein
MPHPDGVRGNWIAINHNFKSAYTFIKSKGSFEFSSTTGQSVIATTGCTQNGSTPTIVFKGHGNVCPECWGYRKNCSGTRIGHCVEAMDKDIM